MAFLDWIPSLYALDALMLLGAVGLPLFAGVPLLLATIRVPRLLGLEVVDEEELSNAQRLWFDDIEARLGSDGYRSSLS